MPKPKLSILTRQLWGRRVAVQVKIDSDQRVRREIDAVRAALSSPAMSQIFLLIVKGTRSPSELASHTLKSKYAVSAQLAALKRVGLVKQARLVRADMRRKSYEVSWEKIGRIFNQDHALELEIYENQLGVEGLGEVRGNLTQLGLAVSGNGKLGLVREFVPHDSDSIQLKEMCSEMDRLIWEFIEFFKGYLKERRFHTVREYLLGAYEELSEHYGRLPKNSELNRFFEFADRAFKRMMPIEEIWRKYVPKKLTTLPALFKSHPRREPVIKLLAEAGSADSSGRYVLNSEAQAAIKPGAPLRIYPAYTYS